MAWHLVGMVNTDAKVKPGGIRCDTYRAWLGDNGEPLTVQKELMRHASIQTTLNTYGGGMMESMREAHGRVVRRAIASNER